MRIRILLALIFILITTEVFAQKGEPVVLRVIYKFKHVNDLNRPNQPYEEEMILRLGKTESRYGSWTEESRAQVAKKSGPVASKGSVGGGGSFGFVPTVFVQSKGVQDFDLIQYPVLDKLSRVIKLSSSNYMIETNLPIIDWKVYQENKEIGGYTCQKAIGFYAGRTYVAWFALELPFRNGPWKLWGLPGLILEAKDLTGEVSFSFSELTKGEVGENTALRNTRIVKVSEKAFEQAVKAFEKDPVAAYQSQLPIGAKDKVQIGFRDDSGDFYYGEEGKKRYDSYKKNLKQRKSNPLELKAP